MSLLRRGGVELREQCQGVGRWLALVLALVEGAELVERCHGSRRTRRALACRSRRQQTRGAPHRRRRCSAESDAHADSDPGWAQSSVISDLQVAEVRRAVGVALEFGHRAGPFSELRGALIRHSLDSRWLARCDVDDNEALLVVDLAEVELHGRPGVLSVRTGRVDALRPVNMAQARRTARRPARIAPSPPTRRPSSRSVPSRSSLRRRCTNAPRPDSRRRAESPLRGARGFAASHPRTAVSPESHLEPA